MNNNRLYSARYMKFETESKKSASVLIGSDCLVGDRYTVEFEYTVTGLKMWFINKFNVRCGFTVSSEVSELMVLHESGMKVSAILSFIAFTQDPAPGHYWGEFAVFAYDPTYSNEFEGFISRVSKIQQDGFRCDLEIGQQGLERIISGDTDFTPIGRKNLPNKLPNTVILKSKLSAKDKLIEKGRSRSIGCFISSWVFLLLLVTGIVFFLTR